MILKKYEISPDKLEFELLAENDAEIQLLKFAESQVLTIRLDENWTNRAVLDGHISR